MSPTWWDGQRSPGRSWRFIPACAGNSTFGSAGQHGPPVHPRVCGELSLRHQIPRHPHGSSPRVRGTRHACAVDARPRPVHPRVCGELAFQRRVRFRVDGSSPRVRGTPLDDDVKRLPVRFIPACAGNSERPLGSQRAGAVHPRVCGELDGPEIVLAETLGSSPRVRGTRAVPGAPRRRPCSSPRVRGTRTRQEVANARITVHPRVCGELLDRPLHPPIVHGSSPRVRGTQVAGKPRMASTTVHPRVCGELIAYLAPAVQGPGSSPRVRGTRSSSPRTPGGCRFIPACAGNSKAAVRSAASTPVHPRVCGELAVITATLRSSYGSSPRVRGTRIGRSTRRWLRRFIPACAGNSPSPWMASAKPAVHPRVCGELDAAVRVFRDADGSSPRVRGTRVTVRDSLPRVRFIPACAGNSPKHTVLPHTSRGSSPRVRGTRGSTLEPRHDRRFIPACAGNSTTTTAAKPTPAVHPRVCGELLAVGVENAPLSGSSPRVRGTPAVLGRTGAGGRFIPACAGNSTTSPATTRR